MEEEQLDIRAFRIPADIVLHTRRRYKAGARLKAEYLSADLGSAVSLKDIKALLVLMHSALDELRLPVYQQPGAAACAAAVFLSQQFKVVVVLKVLIHPLLFVYSESAHQPLSFTSPLTAA